MNHDCVSGSMCRRRTSEGPRGLVWSGAHTVTSLVLVLAHTVNRRGRRDLAPQNTDIRMQAAVDVEHSCREVFDELSLHIHRKRPFPPAPIGAKRNMKRSTFLAPSNAAPNNACQNNPKGMKLIIRSVLSMHSLLVVHSTLPRRRNEPQASC